MKHFIKPTLIMISVFTFINMLSFIVERTKDPSKTEGLSPIVFTRPQLSRLVQLRPAEQVKEKEVVKTPAPKKKVKLPTPQLLPSGEVAP